MGKYIFKLNTKYVLQYPIIFSMLWLLVSIFLFTYGPYKYDIPNSFIFYAYIFSVNLTLLLGYQSRVGKNGCSYSNTISINKIILL